ncbi:MAG: hypothetical protein A2201_07535 [Alicyclobacillus sp. RIFOXYA1_FULL_53_8]|nr:MAG: hypothetical protein A2201_07535 [Alicyclobacillus sp. RIFOXYA1_FULL_53_8]
MLDVLFVAELAWCSIFIAVQGIQRALLYSGGIIASGYAASQFSGWITRIFVPQTSETFLWLQAHVTTSVQGVSVLSRFIPAEPVASGMAQATWITMHIVKSLFFIGITASIFLLFLVVSHLSIALYDRPQPAKRKGETLFWTPLLALTTGLYATVLTGVLVGNLAWFQDFTGLAWPVSHSLAMAWMGRLMSFTQGHFTRP